MLVSSGTSSNSEAAVIDFSSQANKHEWPLILYAVTLVAAYVLEWLLPLPSGWMPFWLRALGAAAAAVGIAVALSALLAFLLARTSVKPSGRAQTLVASGIYRVTRNPMYLAGVLFFAGLGLAWPSLWLVLLTPAMAVGLDRLAIRREERHLEARFDDAFRDYCGRVRRWL
jgi:protein-S-isoprenylcysteine O-methyltransferase Ste14